jgi:hypothetical protein
VLDDIIKRSERVGRDFSFGAVFSNEIVNIFRVIIYFVLSKKRNEPTVSQYGGYVCVYIKLNSKKKKG